MNEKQIKNFAKVVLSYENLEGWDKFDVNIKISEGWRDANKKFNDYCNQDEEYATAKTELKKIDDIFSSSAGDYFYDVITEEDYEYDEQLDDYYAIENDQKRFNKDKFIFAKELAETWEEVVKQFNEEEQKIKNRRLNLFKEKNLEKLNKKRAYCNDLVEKYAQYKEKEDLKKYYQENKETLIKPFKDLVNKKENEYAKQVFDEVIEQEPYLICQHHQTKPHTYSYTALDNVFNNLREDVVEFIEQKAKEQFASEEMENEND